MSIKNTSSQEAPEVKSTENSKSFLKRFLLKLKNNFGKTIFTTLVVISGLIFIVAGIWSYYQKSVIASFISNAPERSTAVNSIIAEPSDWQSQYFAGGTIRNLDTVSIVALATGNVDRVLVKSGDKVKTGDLLIEIDSKAEISSLKAQEAQLALAVSTYSRYQKLYTDGAISKFDLDKARTDYQSQLNNVASTKASIAKKSIVSPIDGVVGTITVLVGDLVQAGTNVVSVVGANKNLSRVDLHLSPSITKNISIGNKAHIEVSGNDLVVTGQISAISPTIDPASGTVEVQALFDGKGRVTNGMFASLTIAANPIPNQIVLPDLAISYNVYGSIIYSIEPLTELDAARVLSKYPKLDDHIKLEMINNLGRAKFQSIKILGENPGFMRVEGIAPNTIIISNGVGVTNGSLVSILPVLGTAIDPMYKFGKLPVSFTKIPVLTNENGVEAVKLVEPKLPEYVVQQNDERGTSPQEEAKPENNQDNK